MSIFPRTNTSQARFQWGRTSVALWVGLLLLVVGVSPAETDGALPQDIPPDSTAPIVRSVEIRGGDHFSKGTLKQHIQTRPNRRILGIPGLTWWRWVYRLGSTDWMWDRLGSTLQAGGEPPAHLDSTTVASDVERLQLFYRQQGFQEATVDYEVQFRSSSNRVNVIFLVDAGEPTYVRRVQYEGMEPLSPDQRRRLVEGTTFQVASRDHDRPLSFSVRNERYRVPQLMEERRRLLTFLQNEGYAAVSRDSVQAVVSSVAPDSFDVSFQVEMGPRYRFGDVNVQINGPEVQPPRYDTLDIPVHERGGYRPRVIAQIQNESRLRPGILQRSLQFTPGDYYNQSEVQETKRRLEGTGVFAFTSLTPQFEEVVAVDSTDASYLPVQVEARTRQRHRVRAETFALQRESPASPEADLNPNEFGVGLSGVYENVNAFGGGETFQLRTSGSVATSGDFASLSSVQFEGTTSLILPYLIRPFGQFENLFDLTSARTRISLSALTAQSRELGLRIRSRSNARLRVEMDHTPTRVSLVDIMDLSISNPDTLSGFQEGFLENIFGQGVQDPVQRQQILEDYTRPQINTALRYTFRSMTANPLRRRSGHRYELSGEVGNSLPLLFDRFVFAPGTMEYSLPGFFGGSDDLGGRLLYLPYVRATADFRRYVSLSRGTTLAMKFLGGMAHPTGRRSFVPLDRRFFSGGANSVRGWRLRKLGPGGVRIPNDTTSTSQEEISTLLGGDIKLESSVELRTTFLRSFLAADWVGASFLDVGNIWFGPRNRGLGQGEEEEDAQRGDATSVEEPSGKRGGRFRGLSSLTDLGVGSGFGLRLEWEYLVVRFDLAYRLHDPVGSSQDGPLLHFGIGHSF